jgi:hypothetical protein
VFLLSVDSVLENCHTFSLEIHTIAALLIFSNKNNDSYKIDAIDLYRVSQRKCIHNLDAHNTHINRDRITVFCSDVSECC